MINFAVVDDHPMVLEGLRSLFSRSGDARMAWGASRSEDARSRLTDEPVDALLLDIQLGAEDGLELCKQLRRDHPALPILMLTSYCERSMVKRAFAQGASGYLLKSAGYDQILTALHAIRMGEVYLPADLKDFLLAEAMGQTHSLQGMFNPPTLTPREEEVLHLIVDGLTNAEIAERLFVSESTAITHRKSILHKYGQKNTASLVRYVLVNGIVK